MRNFLLLLVWMLSAVALFYVLVIADEYSRKECIKSGGSWEQFVWSKYCCK